jgi:magnesium chelatase family protein
MVTKTFTASILGLQVQKIETEINIGGGLPSTTIVGLPDKAVQESKERIRAAISHSGSEYPMGKVVINLAPADIIKSGSGFDLPIAVGILNLQGSILPKIPESNLFIGELALNGDLRPVAGILSICIWAKENSFTTIFVPFGNLKEARLVSDLKIFAVQNLRDLISHLNGKVLLQPIKKLDYKSLILQEPTTSLELRDIWINQILE